MLFAHRIAVLMLFCRYSNGFSCVVLLSYVTAAFLFYFSMVLQVDLTQLSCLESIGLLQVLFSPGHTHPDCMLLG
uniref:Uncharacterized protein n=1 Tax=Rhizophora mucronata TaxID=61149 RepID=A0A2P2LBP9_RHIMU